MFWQFGIGRTRKDVSGLAIRISLHQQAQTTQPSRGASLDLNRVYPAIQNRKEIHLRVTALGLSRPVVQLVVSCRSQFLTDKLFGNGP